MNIINCIRLQNRIREVSKSVSEDGFDSMEVDKNTLYTIGVLATRLRNNLEELGLDEIAQRCEESIMSIGELLENLEDLQGLRIDGKKHTRLTYGVKDNIQHLYVFTISDVASEL